MSGKNTKPCEWSAPAPRALTPTLKLRAAMQLYYSARAFKAAWIRSQHPELSEDEVLRRVKEAFMYARD